MQQIDPFITYYILASIFAILVWMFVAFNDKKK